MHFQYICHSYYVQFNSVPEILRTNLSNIVLYLKVLGINDVLGFDFIEPPSPDQIEEVLYLAMSLYILVFWQQSNSTTGAGSAAYAGSDRQCRFGDCRGAQDVSVPGGPDHRPHAH